MRCSISVSSKSWRNAFAALLALAACTPTAAVVIPPVTTAVAPAVAMAPRFDYPLSRRTDDADVLHGVRVPDPYRWLETDSDETKAWFEAQDARARREIAKLDTKPMIDALAPLYANPLPRLGTRRKNLTFVRTGPKLTMKPDSGAESVVFDEAQHAEHGSVTRWMLSRDGGHVLVEQTRNGLDRRTAVVVETSPSGRARVLERLNGFEDSAVVWTKGGFFYAFTPADAPHAGRFGQRSIRFHAVGTEQSSDRVVVPPTNDANSSGGMNPMGVTKDGARLLVQTESSWQRSTYAVVDLTRHDWKVVTLAPPNAGVEAAIVVIDAIYVLVRRTDGTGEVGRIEGTSSTPKPVMTAPPELLDLDAFGPYAMVTRAAVRGTRDASSFLHYDFYDPTWKKLSTLETPRGKKLWFSSPDPDAPKLFATGEGLGTPASRFDVDPRDGSLTEIVPSKVDWRVADFRIDTLDATSKDGTVIPITILRRRDTPVDGTAALALYGYGGFRGSAEPVFYPGWMVWPREKGRIFAQCHMRGGVEFGPAWHQDGAVKNRQRTLDDFHACLEALHSARYSTPGRTVIQGWSHGGMMVTAAALQRPELQRVVIAQAPLEDMIRYVHFGRGGITEYGDPDNEEELKALLGFSPYQRVKPSAVYPAFFITAPSADERVHPMHPRKIAAALQYASNQAGGGEVLLKVLWEAGHLGGAKDDANAVMAEGWAFALSKMVASP